ncbi:hypothetical protein [Amycolatopsis mediterranei]|uniref:Uncharacterized protein n=1 Tax=Amycolatopsis mediterranei (strain S699) TaxID=713604 RepID=A0A9R0NU33_AMYMS|nr:hypothetical protein [Amycolatopsis mediterranei]AEK40647.1 hypothetical protein RAM_10785 [Amycolatopsis mediterranei S699]UZF69128.1 hypothetical protein ISP_002255 [Amycolatopsis mediterranei]
MVRTLVGLTMVAAGAIVLQPLAQLVLPLLVVAVIIAWLVRTFKRS